ncbi:hypothetical protein QUB68_00380 [Microcoleus sp. A006_D1]|uniref:hypothetical protein n=1 Tax=Microcoleus sp. A006_D1 TaxID=3055267 RepID=UPI002FCFE5FF
MAEEETAWPLSLPPKCRPIARSHKTTTHIRRDTTLPSPNFFTKNQTPPPTSVGTRHCRLRISSRKIKHHHPHP